VVDLQVIAGAGALEHKQIVELSGKLFTKLSSNNITAAQLIEKDPAHFTGSEVCVANL
jgi:processing peptidase subunit beta